MGNTLERRKWASRHRNHYSVFPELVATKRQENFYLLPILTLAEYHFASNGAAEIRDWANIDQPPENIGNRIYIDVSSHNADGYAARLVLKIRG